MTAMMAAMMAMVGLVAGSFLGVVVRRLPMGRSIVRGRSACEHCGHQLGMQDLVPVASYLWLHGRCRFCHEPIARMHLLIELACAAVALVAGLMDGNDAARLVAGCVLGWGLVALGWIDWTHMRLPDALTLPLVVLGLVATVASAPDAVADHAAAAMLGYLLFRLVAWVYRMRRGREGLGQGDAKLMAAAGAWVGLAGLPLVMAGGAAAALALAAGLRLAGRRVAQDTAIPFGPCLAAAIWLAWLWPGLAG